MCYRRKAAAIRLRARRLIRRQGRDSPVPLDRAAGFRMRRGHEARSLGLSLWDDARVKREGVRGLWLGCAAVVVPALVAAVATLSSADAAAEPFLPTPATLSISGEQPRVVIGDDGQVAAVWMHGFRNGVTSGPAPVYNKEVAAATGSALSGLWQMPVLISMPGFSILPEVAIDAHGDAAAVWLDSYPGNGTIDASYRAANSGVWQPPVTVSAAGEKATDQHVLVEPDGDALAWWAKLGEGVGPGIVAYETAFRPAASGAWGPAREFAAERHPGGLQLAVDARGDVFAAWGSGGAVEAAMLPVGSASWDAPVMVAPAPAPPLNVEGVQLAVSRDGYAAAVWRQVDKQCPLRTFSGQSGSVACVLPVTLRSSVRSAVTGVWSAPEEIPNAPRAEAQAPARAKIAAPAVSPLGDQEPQIAVDSAGDAFTTWAQFEATKARLEASVRPASMHGWLAPTTLSPTGGDFAIGGGLAIDDFGRALVTWDVDGVIQGSVGSAATGEWQEPVDVTPEEGNLRGSEPHAAVNATGDAVLIWSTCCGPISSMQAITFNLSTGVPGYRPPLPLLTNATMTRQRFRVRKSQHKHAAPTVTRFRFTVFPEASVTIAIDELRPGHRAGGRCATSSGRAVHALRTNCLVESIVTTLESREAAGPRSIPFSGTFPRKIVDLGATKARLSRIVSLKPGRYAAVLTATNATGTSAPVTLRFTVAR
jgi:hypothetical protein